MPDPIDSVAALNNYGRIRLSEHFFMREMLYSEVGNVHGIPNIPEDPDRAIEVGRILCTRILEPLRTAFGHVSLRSAYRSPRLNGFCNARFTAGDTACWCTDNAMNAARHIWDRRDDAGYLGATATVFLPGYLDHYERTGDQRPLAWWIVDNIPDFAEIFFFKPLCAFNIRWYEGPSEKAIWLLDPPARALLTKQGEPGFEGDHSAHYAHIIRRADRRSSGSPLMFALTHLDHVGLRVTDLARAQRFYEKLGFTPDPAEESPTSKARGLVNAAGLRIHLIYNGETPAGGNVLMDVPVKWPGYTHAAFIVDDLDALVAWFQAGNIRITEGPSIFGNGRRKVCFIRDPDLNVLEFNQIL